MRSLFTTIDSSSEMNVACEWLRKSTYSEYTSGNRGSAVAVSRSRGSSGSEKACRRMTKRVEGRSILPPVRGAPCIKLSATTEKKCRQMCTTDFERRQGQKSDLTKEFAACARAAR